VTIVTFARISAFERECFGDIAALAPLLRQSGGGRRTLPPTQSKTEPTIAIPAKPFPARGIDLEGYVPSPARRMCRNRKEASSPIEDRENETLPYGALHLLDHGVVRVGRTK
jgi:hypothetical protein